MRTMSWRGGTFATSLMLMLVLAGCGGITIETSDPASAGLDAASATYVALVTAIASAEREKLDGQDVLFYGSVGAVEHIEEYTRLAFYARVGDQGLNKQLLLFIEPPDDALEIDQCFRVHGVLNGTATAKWNWYGDENTYSRIDVKELAPLSCEDTWTEASKAFAASRD